ncbi:hypothetical protein JCM10550A_03950 [Methanogenium cariaci]|jgi:hypothetical protein
MEGRALLKSFCSVLWKSVITLPRMFLYFLQPITFNESVFRNWFEEKNKR